MDLTRELKGILIDLIGIESVTDNEKQLCDTLNDYLNTQNGELTREGNSLVYKLDFGREETVALVGHIDTVPVDNSSINAKIIENEIWGRGACDMKAGLSIMLKMIHEINLGLITPRYNLVFVFYDGEEGPCPNGITRLIKANLLNGINFAFVLEPTEGRYSTGCLGFIAAKKEVIGISAHSANPKTGKNALIEATEIFNKIEQMNNKISHDSKIDGLEFYETVNVTTFNTFNAFNVVPPRVEMTVNFRFSPIRTADEAKKLLFTYLGEDHIINIDEANSCYIGESGKKFLLDGIDREIMQAWTDIAQLNQAGIPSVNFGPGSIKNAHKPNERINITELNNFYTQMVNHIAI